MLLTSQYLYFFHHAIDTCNHLKTGVASHNLRSVGVVVLAKGGVLWNVRVQVGQMLQIVDAVGKGTDVEVISGERLQVVHLALSCIMRDKKNQSSNKSSPPICYFLLLHVLYHYFANTWGSCNTTCNIAIFFIHSH